jgi:hypothetical protein
MKTKSPIDVTNPGDQTENNQNRQAFPGSPQHMVMEDAAGGPEVRGARPTAPPHSSVTGALQQIGKPGEKPGHNLVRWTAAQNYNRAADTTRGWNNDTAETWSDSPEEPARASVRPEGQSLNLAVGKVNQLNENDEFDRRNERRFWSHPNWSHDWHDGHTSHHNPRPWDKQQAMELAHSMGLIKSDSRHAETAMPFGQLQPGTKTDLNHYDLQHKLPEVSNLVRQHGFKVSYSGGKYGKPDFSNQNYDTGHIVINDPTPASGDPNERNATDAWRQLHELSHALTLPQVNNVYGEGKRVGTLGHNLTSNEAMRAVHWEWAAAHKQRELAQNIGVHIPDETFHRELNTIMHDAVHRVLTGQAVEPSGAGFTPHSHRVPLETSLDMVRNEMPKLGLAGHHELIRKHEPRPMVEFLRKK